MLLKYWNWFVVKTCFQKGFSNYFYNQVKKVWEILKNNVLEGSIQQNKVKNLVLKCQSTIWFHRVSAGRSIQLHGNWQQLW